MRAITVYCEMGHEYTALAKFVSRAEHEVWELQPEPPFPVSAEAVARGRAKVGSWTFDNTASRGPASTMRNLPGPRPRRDKAVQTTFDANAVWFACPRCHRFAREDDGLPWAELKPVLDELAATGESKVSVLDLGVMLVQRRP